MSGLTQQMLKERLHYNPNSGVFTWRARPERTSQDKTWNTRWVGRPAGSIKNHGYRAIGLNGKFYRAHRLAWLYVYGRWPGEIDHINHNPDDNRIKNLRKVSHAENGQNQSIRCDNSSGIVGVSWHERTEKWLAQIKVDGKSTYLGLFKDVEDAQKTRKYAEARFGFHKNHGLST